jgi:hypothetical protein
MPPQHDLVALALRVESGSDEDRALDGDVWHALYPEGEWHRFDDMWCRRDPEDGAAWDLPFRFTSSVDAVVALIEEKLPGAYAMIEMGVLGAGNLADVSVQIGEDYRAFRSEAPPPAPALLAAALRAMKEEGR